MSYHQAPVDKCFQTNSKTNCLSTMPIYTELQSNYNQMLLTIPEFNSLSNSQIIYDPNNPIMNKTNDLFYNKNNINVIEAPSSDQTNADDSTPICLKLIDYYCPQHGQIIIPLESPKTSIYNPIMMIYSNPRVSNQDKIALQSNDFYLNSKSKNEFFLNQKLKYKETKDVSNKLIRYYTEYKSIKLNMILCAITIAMWLPFIMATLSHLLLSGSKYFYLLSVKTLVQFKWLVYLSAIVYPISFMLIDTQLARLSFRCIQK